MPDARFLDWSDQDIADAYQKGATQRAIAAECGIAPAAVRKILRRMQVEIRSGPAPVNAPSNLPENKIVAEYQAGASTTKLAQVYGTSAETIRRILKRHDVSVRAAHHAIASTANYRQPMSAEQRARTVELYLQGLSAAQVAKEMGFASKRTVLNVVNAAGVTRPGTRGVAEDDLKSPTMQEIAKRYQAGEAIQVLAREYGISRSTLQRRLSALGVR
jgi:transposase-like protein